MTFFPLKLVGLVSNSQTLKRPEIVPTIRFKGSSDHQYSWKESFDVFSFFLNGVDHQGVVITETTIFGWV